MPADGDALWLRCGRKVEGAGHWCTPVEEERPVVVLTSIQAHPADIPAVEAFFGGIVAGGVDVYAPKD